MTAFQFPRTEAAGQKTTPNQPLINTAGVNPPAVGVN